MKGHISSAESEHDLLRAKVNEIQAVMLVCAMEAAQSQATELEEALNRSLAQLKTSDMTIESQQECLLKLKKLNRELISEKQTLYSFHCLHCAHKSGHMIDNQICGAKYGCITPLKPLLTLIHWTGNPYPSHGSRVLVSKGKGREKKPRGYPGHTQIH